MTAASNNRGLIIFTTLVGLVAGVLPLLVAPFLPLKSMEYSRYGFAIFFLAILGTLAAKTGGSSMKSAMIRIVFWGTIAMGLTALVGYLFGVNLN